MSLPKFTNEALCASDTKPDDWFPEFDLTKGLRQGMRERFSRTPDALRARSICLACPAYDECLEYSLQYKDLYGIWANLDQFEREREQQLRGLKRSDLVPAYVNELPPVKPMIDEYFPIESEWHDEKW